jgi:hypothetical protein
MARQSIRKVRVRIGDLAGPEHIFEGREAWAFTRLIQVGDTGLTSIEEPGVRLAHYIMKIRRAGIAVEMVRDKNLVGAYGGTFGRYFLRTPIVVIETIRHGEAADVAA